MFEESSFKEAYKTAYDMLTPDKKIVTQLEAEAFGQADSAIRKMFRPAVAVMVMLLLLMATSTPVLAGIGNMAYAKIAEIAPGLADYIIPVNLTDTRKGITMQVEAIHVNGKDAELLISFADKIGSAQDLISGTVDMHDSYNLKGYGNESNLGGCSFVEYDEETDKAYFKVCVSSEEKFDRTKLQFTVRQLLIENKEYEMELDVDSLILNPDLKECILSGKGGALEGYEALFYKTEESFPRFASRVMDVTKPEDGMKDTIRVTGIGYSNGILRVQISKGTFSDAVRHVQIYILNEDGTRRYSDISLGWQEELGGEKLAFNEQWFTVPEEQLEDLRLYGTFYETDQSVDGKWRVTVNLGDN